jgi:hypothetical protein
MFHRAGFADTEPMRLQRGGIGCNAISQIISESFDRLGGDAKMESLLVLSMITLLFGVALPHQAHAVLWYCYA